MATRVICYELNKKSYYKNPQILIKANVPCSKFSVYFFKNKVYPKSIQWYTKDTVSVRYSEIPFLQV